MRIIDCIHKVAGALACIFLVLIGIIVMSQIIGRLFGILVPSAQELAGYSLAATSFLGLAYSYRRGAHIRVNLLVDRFPDATRRAIHLFSLAVASAMISCLTYFIALLVWESLKFHAMSTGLVSIPLWIPQLSMLAGILLFSLALIEDLVLVAMGKKPNYEKNNKSIEVI